jgi:hypothetical protein
LEADVFAGQVLDERPELFHSAHAAGFDSSGWVASCCWFSRLGPSPLF